MENVCVITDFEDLVSSRKFEQIEVPETLADYKLYAGGNFFFITNNKMTVRFHLRNFDRTIPENAVESWITKIKSLYPRF